MAGGSSFQMRKSGFTKLDFKTTILSCINRIHALLALGEAQTLNAEFLQLIEPSKQRYVLAVDNLADIMAAYQDDVYLNEIKNYPDDDYKSARARFQALSRLCSRAGLLLDKERREVF